VLTIKDLNTNRKPGYNRKQGLKWYRKRNYLKAVSCLENAVRERKDDHQAFLYLGYASLFTGDLEGALKYFRGGLIVREGDIGLMKGLAYVYLKNERLEDAISLWGEVLAKRPSEKNVKKLLERLRHTEDFEGFVENADMKQFISFKAPFFTRLKPYLIGLGVTAGVIIMGIVFYATPLYRKALERFYPEIAHLREVTLPKESPVVEQGEQNTLYSYTDKEIADSFLRVKKYIYKGKVNAAIVTLNKIMLSNASLPAKERFKVLYTFINPPDPLSIDYVPRYFEILKEPTAFEGVYVLWNGRVSGLQKRKDAADFDLLVSYKGDDTVEGIARVSIQGTYFIENKQMVEIFGVYKGYDKSTGRLILQGLILRSLGV
jgi:tetratricopeptide (TPR) repeat protein